jgi:CxxC motif-containing protein (DUF1111 family)
MNRAVIGIKVLLLALVVPLFGTTATGQVRAARDLPTEYPARDPGVRGGSPGAGGPIDGLNESERAFFGAGQAEFGGVQSVQGGAIIPGTNPGLGPRFNLDSCAGCHAQPASGGTSPLPNPQVAVATKADARNAVPFFVRSDGPVREARFKYTGNGTRDGGVQGLFTIRGRPDAAGCEIDQPDFETAAASNNLSFRIPTPVYGAGLIEAIPDAVIVANKSSDQARKQALGISGRENRSGSDGTITRFGWKAQVKSLELFAGEAYNVEQGVTNEVFPTERDETPGCLFNATPEDRTRLEASASMEVVSNVVRFALYMKFLAPPKPAPDTASIVRGRALFTETGCALCHTPHLTTGTSSSAALDQQPAHLYSDLLLHNMGPGLADDIIQGRARGDEFRTAPLWGLGQRIFFLHDGRTTDLLEAIQAHASAGNEHVPPSEANAVIANFNVLSESGKQDILNFLRGL